jgi:hypothetical protein
MTGVHHVISGSSDGKLSMGVYHRDDRAVLDQTNANQQHEALSRGGYEMQNEFYDRVWNYGPAVSMSQIA